MRNKNEEGVLQFPLPPLSHLHNFYRRPQCSSIRKWPVIAVTNVCILFASSAKRNHDLLGPYYVKIFLSTLYVPCVVHLPFDSLIQPCPRCSMYEAYQCVQIRQECLLSSTPCTLVSCNNHKSYYSIKVDGKFSVISFWDMTFPRQLYYLRK